MTPNHLSQIILQYDSLLTRYVRLFTRNEYLAPILVKSAFENYYEVYRDNPPEGLRMVLKQFCIDACAEHLSKEFKAQLN